MEIEQYVIGGLLLGGGVGFVYLSVGLIVDVVGSYAAALSLFLKGDLNRSKRFTELRFTYMYFIFGLVVSGVLYTLFVNGTMPYSDVSGVRMLIGGVLVGLGATITGGGLLSHCTWSISELGRTTSFVSFAFVSIVLSVSYLTRLILMP